MYRLQLLCYVMKTHCSLSLYKAMYSSLYLCHDVNIIMIVRG